MEDDVYFYRPDAGYGLPHDPFKAIVAPRIIGWISSLTAAGTPTSRHTASARQCVPIRTSLRFSSEGYKDSVRNIEATREFAWNFVSRELAEKMNATSEPVDPHVDEFRLCGVAPAPGRAIRAPHVAASPAVLECKLLDVREIKDLNGDGTDHWLVLGQVAGVHIRRAYLRDGLSTPSWPTPCCAPATGRTTCTAASGWNCIDLIERSWPIRLRRKSPRNSWSGGGLCLDARTGLAAPPELLKMPGVAVAHRPDQRAQHGGAGSLDGLGAALQIGFGRRRRAVPLRCPAPRPSPRSTGRQWRCAAGFPAAAVPHGPGRPRPGRRAGRPSRTRGCDAAVRWWTANRRHARLGPGHAPVPVVRLRQRGADARWPRARCAGRAFPPSAGAFPRGCGRPVRPSARPRRGPGRSSRNAHLRGHRGHRAGDVDGEGPLGLLRRLLAQRHHQPDVRAIEAGFLGDLEQRAARGSMGLWKGWPMPGRISFAAAIARHDVGGQRVHVDVIAHVPGPRATPAAGARRCPAGDEHRAQPQQAAATAACTASGAPQ